MGRDVTLCDALESRFQVVSFERRHEARAVSEIATDMATTLTREISISRPPTKSGTSLKKGFTGVNSKRVFIKNKRQKTKENRAPMSTANVVSFQTVLQ